MGRLTEASLKRAKNYAAHIVKMDLTDSKTGKVYKDCQVLGGEEGVYAICRQHRNDCSDLLIELHGDDGFWWETGCYDETWVEGRIACLRRV